MSKTAGAGGNMPFKGPFSKPRLKRSPEIREKPRQDIGVNTHRACPAETFQGGAGMYALPISRQPPVFPINIFQHHTLPVREAHDFAVLGGGIKKSGFLALIRFVSGGGPCTRTKV